MYHSLFKRLWSTLIVGALTLFCTSAVADKATTSMLTNTCIACHGTGGSSAGPAIPSLATLSRNYMVGAMLAYKYADDPDGLEKALDKITQDKLYEDLEAFERYSTIMTRIAKGYTDEEILMMGNVFADSPIERPTQTFDRQKAALGKRLHKKFCEKCHEDEGRLTEDDTGMLAGQWMPYLSATMEDYIAGRRGMPKKMKSKMKDLEKDHGMAGVEALIHYYGSINK